MGQKVVKKELFRTPVLKTMKQEACQKIKNKKSIMNMNMSVTYLIIKYSKRASTVKKVMKQFMMNRVSSTAGYVVWQAMGAKATKKNKKLICILYQRDTHGYAMSVRRN